MSLHLNSKNLLRRAKDALESGVGRTTAITAVSGGVGLLAGKREDAKKVPIAAVIAGAGLNVVGLHTLGDGAMSGGATLIGYRMGAKWARKAAQKRLAAPPAAGPPLASRQGPRPGKRR